MPKYQYRCPSCSQQFDVTLSYAEFGKAVACPADGSACEQVFTPPTFFMKGDRFEQAATARAHWEQQGQGGEIAGHGPPPQRNPDGSWFHAGHDHDPDEPEHFH